MHILMFFPDWDGRIPVPAILKPRELWTGKQLFSLLIDPRVNMSKKHAAHLEDEDETPLKFITPHDTKVLIEGGRIISGILCKNTLQGFCQHLGDRNTAPADRNKRAVAKGGKKLEFGVDRNTAPVDRNICFGCFGLAKPLSPWSTKAWGFLKPF